MKNCNKKKHLKCDFVAKGIPKSDSYKEKKNVANVDRTNSSQQQIKKQSKAFGVLIFCTVELNKRIN